MKQLLIGAHTSAAGGVEKAIYEGAEIGATTVQLFTANQRQWHPRVLTEEMREKFQKALDETGLSHIMSHDSYLINLGSPNKEVEAKSLEAFRLEIQRCHFLGLTYMNFHPGAALKEDRTLCLKRIIENLTKVEDLFQNVENPCTLLLEMTAGQGSTLGMTLEEIATILLPLSRRLPIGVCVDTCHIFAAGYNIATRFGFETFLTDFDRIIGLSYLRAMHLNDSKKECGSRVDRHASLGQGCIGLEPFSWIMQDKRLEDIPKYLETPEGLEVWKQEIAWLKQQAI